jgi:hypothetical protein
MLRTKCIAIDRTGIEQNVDAGLIGGPIPKVF